MKYQGCLINLHPTMYLLIPQQQQTQQLIQIYLHPTMYLLIQDELKPVEIVQDIYIPLCIY